MKTNKWLAIVNMAVGGGKGGKDWEQIAELLSKHGFDYDVELTSRRLHAW